MMRAASGFTAIGPGGAAHSCRRDAHRARVGLQRAFWALMILAHLPGWCATLGVDGAAGAGLDLGRAVLLTATQLFFLFKLLDVHWLRLPRGRRAWLAAACVIALLHAGAARRLFIGGETLDASFMPALVVGSVATALRAPLDTRLPESRAGWPRALRHRMGDCRNRLLAHVEQRVPRSRYLLAVCAGHINRAPPA